ncbi:MAG: 50S ribosomal protein L9 [Kiritimatiellae bacterium]|nr:50S ribosomal protein L9 [Kiritimatiellia bacterium]
MSIEVILLKEVPGLGAEGDVVRVKDGFARNRLLPERLAAPVTEATRRKIEKMRRERDARDAEARAESQALADRIAGAACTIPMKTGADGKLYGAVTAQHLSEALALQGITVDKHQIELDEPIRELGVSSVTVRLTPQVSASLKVWVTGA